MADLAVQPMTHRDRKLVYNTSSIFEDNGPTTKSNYDPKRQREILLLERSKVEEKFIPRLTSFPAKDIKQSHAQGHGLITGKDLHSKKHFERETIDHVRHKRDDKAAPVEFWRVPDMYFGKGDVNARNGWTDTRAQCARRQQPAEALL
jgi:hypothetical protein